MRDGAVVLEPFVGLGDGLAFRIAQGVAILVGGHYGFQQMNHRGKLGRRQAVEQLMGVLSIYGHISVSIHGHQHNGIENSHSLGLPKRPLRVCLLNLESAVAECQSYSATRLFPKS